MANREIIIDSEFIKLGALLKYAGVAASGADAKIMIAAGKVLLNGVTETRRGRKIRPGDKVETGGETITLGGKTGGS